jgi:Putative Actinobacterial Holin-X, holin superfamily III
VETEQPKISLESLFESTSAYVDTRIELTTLKATKKSSEAISSFTTYLIIGGIGFLALMVLNIALGFWLGDLLGKNYYGFFVVTFIYLLIGIIIYIRREKWIANRVANAIIKMLNK